MKIYLVSYQSIMLNRGGPTYKVLHLKNALSALGVEVELFNMWDSNLEISEKELVHIFNAGLATFSLARNLVAYGAKYVVNPIFFSNHDAFLLRSYRLLENLATSLLPRTYSDYRLTRETCLLAEKILPNTTAEQELLIKGLQLPRRKMQVIHNGVEKRFAQADPSLFIKQYGLKDFILYVGHLGPDRKNGLNIIKSLQKIDHPSVIIADILHNEEGEKCRREIEKSSNITLIEWLKHDDPLFASAYAACDTFILPTKYETPGRAALEAGLAGAKIVITPRGGTREYFREMAEYPNPHSVDSITLHIETALNKSKTSDLKEFILQNFVWEVIAEQTKAMYEEVIKNG